MPGVSAPATLEADVIDFQENATQKGCLEINGCEHEITVFEDTESVTKDTSAYISDANNPENVPQEIQSSVSWITPEELQLQDEIENMQAFLNPQGEKKEILQKTRQEILSKENKAQEPSLKSDKNETPSPILKPIGKSLPFSTPREKTYSSLFSLARETAQNAHGERNQVAPRAETDRARLADKIAQIRNKAAEEQQHVYNPEGREKDREGRQNQDERERNQEKDDENERQDQDGQEKHHEKQNQNGRGRQPHISQPKASWSPHTETSRQQGQKIAPVTQVLEETKKRAANEAAYQAALKEPLSMDNLFMRFINLMARILGQAEAEAHSLYTKIKNRTDQVDILIKLLSKINSSTGAIDWSENPEMKQLVDTARAIGVDIPPGKYTWSEEEKKALKENIQMQKDSMDKITQLERTDMQRFLQEASQCHQARSNVLKLMKEIGDTIIYNLRS